MKVMELPREYKTWLEFWESLEKAALTEEQLINYLPRPNLNLMSRDTYPDERVQVITYRTSDIKEMLLSELLAARESKDVFNEADLYKLLNIINSRTTEDNSDIRRKIEYRLEFIFNTREA